MDECIEAGQILKYRYIMENIIKLNNIVNRKGNKTVYISSFNGLCLFFINISLLNL